MNLLRTYLVAIGCCGLLGCGASATLNCTDSAVLSATLNTAKEQVRDLVLFDALGRRKLLEVALTHPKYDEFKMRSDAAYVKDVVADVETFLRANTFSIEAARARPAAKDAHTTSCAADFVMKGPDDTKTFPIRYSVQSAIDAKTIQVEVEGL